MKIKAKNLKFLEERLQHLDARGKRLMGLVDVYEGQGEKGKAKAAQERLDDVMDRLDGMLECMEILKIRWLYDAEEGYLVPDAAEAQKELEDPFDD